MARRSGSETLAVGTYVRLRADILNRRFAPGERLRPADLAEGYGVSLGVLREAFNLLEAKNLVRIDRNRGCHVTDLSAPDLIALTAARRIVEGAALHESVTAGGIAWESEVLAAHHRMSSEPVFLPGEPGVRNEAWALAHLAFHHRLIDACDNPYLLDTCERLSDAAELYRAWSVGAAPAEAAERDIDGEHRALLEAALAHDADRALALFVDHIERTQNLLLQTAQPDSPVRHPAASPSTRRNE